MPGALVTGLGLPFAARSCNHTAGKSGQSRGRTGLGFVFAFACPRLVKKHAEWHAFYGLQTEQGVYPCAFALDNEIACLDFLR